MLQDIRSTRTIGGIVQEHRLQHVESFGREAGLVFLGESGGDAVAWAEEGVPLQVVDAGPLVSGWGTEDVVDLVELVYFASVAGKDGVACENLDEHACGAPNVDGGSVLGLS